MSTTKTLIAALFAVTAPVAASGSEPPAGGEASARRAETCLVGDHTGIADGDALAAARLVCDALRAEGRAVGPPVADPVPNQPSFRVQVQPLGKSVVLSVSEEAAGGQIVTQRVLRVSDIEEVAVAAPRIAEAVVRRIPLEDTARVDNLVREETRVYEKKPGEFFWGAGVVTGAMLASEINGALMGAELRGFYETPDWSVGLAFRFAGHDDDDDSWERNGSAMTTGLSVGGRYFFSQGDVGPFVGGGLSMLFVEAPMEDASYGRGDDSGAGLYAEAGVELLRLRESRLSIDLRLDAPLFTLDGGNDYYYDEFGREHKEEGATGYAMPLTVGVVYAW